MFTTTLGYNDADWIFYLLMLSGCLTVAILAIWYAASRKHILPEADWITKSPFFKLLLALSVVTMVILIVFAVMYPSYARLYVINGSDTSGSLVIGDKQHEIGANSHATIYLRQKADKTFVQVTWGSDPAIQDSIESGIYIVNMNDATYANYEEVLYASKNFDYEFDEESAKYDLGQGIYKVTSKLNKDVYGFGKTPPDEIELSSSENYKVVYDIFSSDSLRYYEDDLEDIDSAFIQRLIDSLNLMSDDSLGIMEENEIAPDGQDSL